MNAAQTLSTERNRLSEYVTPITPANNKAWTGKVGEYTITFISGVFCNAEKP
jgi:hypothetical protein